LAPGQGFLDADDDHVAEPGVPAARAADHLDALDALRPGIVRDVQKRLHLDHGVSTAPVSSCAGRSMSFTTFQRFSRESGRCSSISTRSPVLYSFFSSCAL